MGLGEVVELGVGGDEPDVRRQLLPVVVLSLLQLCLDGREVHGLLDVVEVALELKEEVRMRDLLHELRETHPTAPSLTGSTGRRK